MIFSLGSARAPAERGSPAQRRTSPVAMRALPDYDVLLSVDCNPSTPTDPMTAAATEALTRQLTSHDAYLRSRRHLPLTSWRRFTAYRRRLLQLPL